ncbi:hypothetical protein [Burkholderia sp. IMCC1007]|uniref:hypothetical protein n=1 Tax=Burkholderia sp. IMCC1007 TaxID=3004104 RepID=UPI0022B58F5A|nr:hypothetical protein [Burkholderia sp. IMCC1007]
MNREQVVLGAGLFNDAEARRLESIGSRLARKPAASTLATAELEASISLVPSNAPDRQLAITYILAEETTGIASAVESVLRLSDQDRLLLERIAPAELLFHWEDEHLPFEGRGPAVPVFAAIPLDAASDMDMRALIDEMLRSHKDGLVARAREVGYYREAMAISRDSSGNSLYLLYLELRVESFASMVSRLMNYPKTAFSAWWTPRYIQLVGKQLMERATSETVLRKRAMA